MVQLSHLYMTLGKTIALTRQMFVGKVMSLFFNMLSRLVITFLPSSKCFLILWLQSPSAVIWQPQKIKSVIVSPSICHEVMDAMILVFWTLSFKPTFSTLLFHFHQIRSDQISCSVMSDSLQPHESQHARPPCPSPTPRVHSDSRLLSQWCHPAISSSVVPFSSCPQSLPASESFQWVNSSHEVAKVQWPKHHSFQRNPRADLLQNGLVGSPCSPRDSQESSPTPQFKSINSSALHLNPAKMQMS